MFDFAHVVLAQKLVCQVPEHILQIEWAAIGSKQRSVPDAYAVEGRVRNKKET